MRSNKLEACIDWAYRSGYSWAEAAAKEYADANMLRVEKEDLGIYGDMLKFVSVASP